MAYKKNTAVTGFTFGLVSATDGSAVTSGTTTGYVTLDGGTQATIAATPIHEGNGQWSVDLATSEMNGDTVGLVFVNASAINASFTISTYTAFDSNLIQINSATLPVDNLELQYDGTGILGENFPSTQGQVANLSTGAGGLSTVATSVTITTGSQTSGTYTSTFAFDGVYHIIEDTGNIIDFYYEASVTESGVLSGVIWDGYVQANNDTVNVFGYDWVTSGWVQIGSIAGTNGASDQEVRFSATIGMTGTGANDGIVRIRFQSTNANAVATDRILFEFASVIDAGFIIHAGTAQAGTANTITLDATASSIDDFYVNTRIITVSGTGAEQENILTDYNGTTKVATVKNAWKITPDATTRFNLTPGQVHCATASGGYNDGGVYIDTTNGIDGNQIGVSGTISNPVKTLASARAICDNASVNSNRIVFDKGVDLATLDQDYARFIFSGRNTVPVDLGGNDVSLSSFVDMVVTGACTNSTGLAVYDNCGIGDLDCGESNFLDCGLIGSVTLSQVNKRYSARNLWANGNINETPEIIFNGDGVNPIHFEASINFGQVLIKGMTSVDIVDLGGTAQITLDSSCNGGTFISAGDISITDNSTTSPAFVQGVIKNTYDNTSGIKGATWDSTDTLEAIHNNTLSISNDTGNIETKVDNLPTLSEIFAGGDADGYTLEEALKLLLSASTGVLAGAATNSITIKAADGSKTRITATVDLDGNRTAVIKDVS